MAFNARNLVAWLALAGLAAATAWALHFPPEAPADFTFVNGAEPQSLDPAKVTGQIEQRILDGIFEGLLRANPQTLAPEPGVAESWEISPDKRTYTFHLRHDARWSDGTPVTAHDFLWSHRRFLDPATASEYSYILWHIKNAKKYNSGEIAPQDHVEVELNRQPAGALPNARGVVLKGTLVRIDEEKGQEASPPAGAGEAESSPKTYIIQIDGQERRLTSGDGPDDCKEVLLDFDEVGVKALDDFTYQLTLDDPTAYFLNILTMFPQYPVNRRCIETYGEREWLEPSHMVTNGPYTLAQRRIRERIRLVKSPTYWDRDNVQIGTIDALAVENTTTALNIYLTGKADWITSTPPAIARQLMATPREDYQPRPYFSIEFLKLNVKRPPLDDPRVRRALALAVNKDDIVTGVMCRGEQSARSLVPPIIQNYMPYQPAQCGARNAEEARRLLKEAGYGDGHPLPKLTLLYNTNERLQLLAEVLQRQWKQELGIDIEPQNTEWGAYLQEMRETKYSIGRSGWIGDYVDPNTFLDMFTTGNENNQTNWSNPRYDRLVEAAQREKDPAIRLRNLHDAEQILMDELPIIPLFVETTNNMIPPYMHGFYENVLDEHPLGRMSIDEAARRRWRESGGRR